MLERDKYQQDYSLNFFPNYSLEEYVSYLSGTYTFRRLFSQSTDFAKQN